MDRQQIRKNLEELVALVSEELADKGAELGDEAELRDGLGLDSLQITELLFEIEEKFEAKISDEEAMQLRTVGDLISLIEGKINQA